MAVVTVHLKAGEPQHSVVWPEVIKMYIERRWMMVVAEEALNMKADSKENWCIDWLEWFWQQEIERAISEVTYDES